MGDGCQPASGHAHYAAVLLRVNLPSLSPLPQLDCRASVQVLRLPGGRSVQATAVTAIPRFRSVQLVSAVMWIEPESFGLVRVAYRLAKRLDTELGFQFRRAEGPNLGLAVKLDDGCNGVGFDNLADPRPPWQIPQRCREQSSSSNGNGRHDRGGGLRAMGVAILASPSRQMGGVPWKR